MEGVDMGDQVVYTVPVGRKEEENKYPLTIFLGRTSRTYGVYLYCILK